MATLHHLPTQGLVSLAKKFQIRRAGDAAGRCLSVSLDFAIAARQRFGVELQLVKWRVVGDPDYIDHWAVLIDDETAIDLTRVQVDGSPRLLGPVADYPAHFTRRQAYPAALLTGAYAAAGAADAARLSNAFLWACGTRLLRFDLAAAWRQRDARAAGRALGEAGSFLTWFGFAGLTRALDARSRTLVNRLARQPGLSARGTAAAAHVNLVSRPTPSAKHYAPAKRLWWTSVALSPTTMATLSSACSVLLAHAA